MRPEQGRLCSAAKRFIAYLQGIAYLGAKFGLGDDHQVENQLNQQIHDRTNVILIQPEWVKGKGDSFDLVWSWMMTEITARLSLIFVIWIGIMLYINRFIRGNKKSNQHRGYRENASR